jgi:hypothetical protein
MIGLISAHYPEIGYRCALRGKRHVPVLQGGWILLSRSCAATVLALVCMKAGAQIPSESHQTIRTVAGTLEINRVDRSFDVLLNNAPLGKLSGGRYAYYADADGKRKAASRLVIADFNGGFAMPPTVLLVDLRSQPPTITTVAKRMDLEKVIWQPEAFLLHAGGKWFKYDHKRLVPLESFKRTLR